MQQKVLSMMSPCSRCLQGPAILFSPRVLTESPQPPRLELKSLCSDLRGWALRPSPSVTVVCILEHSMMHCGAPLLGACTLGHAELVSRAPPSDTPREAVLRQVAA